MLLLNLICIHSSCHLGEQKANCYCAILEFVDKRWYKKVQITKLHGRCGGPGSRPGREHGVEFLGKTLYSHSASLCSGI